LFFLQEKQSIKIIKKIFLIVYVFSKNKTIKFNLEKFLIKYDH
jgi:hypothetical protein